LEKQDWQRALDSFAASRKLYEVLSAKGSVEQELLSKSKMDDIDPVLRFCSYNLKQHGTEDIGTLVEMRLKMSESNQNLIDKEIQHLLVQDASQNNFEFKWLNRTIYSKNESLNTALINIDAAKKNMNKSDDKQGSFDKLLLLYTDAIKIAKDLYDADKVKGFTNIYV
jgi:signal recognition particle subunit SRP68